MAMADRAQRDGSRQRLRLALALLPSIALACGHDWSAAGPDGTDDADGQADGSADADAPDSDRADVPDADGPGEDAEPPDADAPDDDDATEAPDDAPAYVCGNGLLEPGEDCDPPLTEESCTVGTCAGTHTCLGGCAWSACVPTAGPPDGDACSSTTPTTTIADVVGTRNYNGSTCGASDDGATTACGPADGPDVLLRLDLLRSRYAIFDTVGSEFDAVLRVLSGPACPGTELACDDDSAGGTGPQAMLAANLGPGTYWIAIDGKETADMGRWVLNVELRDPGVAPPNDTCAGAIDLNLDRMPRTVDGTTIGAANNADSCPGAVGGDVWYSFALTRRTLVYLDLLDGFTWDAVLDVRRSTTGRCLAATNISCTDDDCGTLRPRYVGLLDAGDYFLLVDGGSTIAAGDFVLRYQGIDDPCVVHAEPLAADGAYTGNTSLGTDEVTPRCSLGIGIPDDLYYAALCPGSTFDATTCSRMTSFDTVLALYASGCGGDSVACNDDALDGCPGLADIGASTLSYIPSSGGAYILAVTGGGWGGLERGSYELIVSGL
jgi:hypothetical protein